ncbi:MAG: tetratricopeptide repeat protein [Promethearchaeota archaeon]
MITTKYERNLIKCTIIGFLYIISLEFCRYILQIPVSLLYYLLVLFIFIQPVGSYFLIDYIIKKIEGPKKEYQINDYLTLKLENKVTTIYVDGEQFIQCKFLLLNIPSNKVRDFDDIESIDEAAERLNHGLEFQNNIKIKIPPETEFWAHCSNLQVWVEYNYNPSLLHSNLAYPLLEAITDAGDPIAKEVFKQEIKIRFESFNFSTQQYLIENGYLNYFNKEERNELSKLILDENVWMKCGYNYLNANKKKKALESFLHARNINPINLEALLAIAQIYVRTKEYKRALQFYNEILEYYPENVEALDGKHSMLQQIKDIIN